MGLYVLDTDTLTLFQRNHETVLARVAERSVTEIAISVITVEEQLSGWYTQLRQAKDAERMAWAYARLAANVRILAKLQVLDYGSEAIAKYAEWKKRNRSSVV